MIAPPPCSRMTRATAWLRKKEPLEVEVHQGVPGALGDIDRGFHGRVGSGVIDQDVYPADSAPALLTRLLISSMRPHAPPERKAPRPAARSRLPLYPGRRVCG